MIGIERIQDWVRSAGGAWSAIACAVACAHAPKSEVDGPQGSQALGELECEMHPVSARTFALTGTLYPSCATLSDPEPGGGADLVVQDSSGRERTHKHIGNALPMCTRSMAGHADGCKPTPLLSEPFPLPLPGVRLTFRVTATCAAGNEPLVASQDCTGK